MEIVTLQNYTGQCNKISWLKEALLDGINVPKSLVLKVSTTELKQAELEYVCNFFGGKSLAVRSATYTEDSILYQQAGMYKTELNTKCTPRNLQSSIFSVLSSYPEEDSEQEILIQEYIHSHIGGVAFSRCPVTRAYVTVVEYSKNAEEVTSGKVDAICLSGISEISNKLGKTGDELVRVINKCRDSYGCEVDVEWLIDKHGNLVILQVRGAYICGIDGGISVSDSNFVQKMSGSKFNKLVDWLDKKFGNIASGLNERGWMVRGVFLSKAEFNGHSFQPRTDYIKIKTPTDDQTRSSSTKVIPFSHLSSELEKYGHDEVFISEWWDAAISGLISKCNDRYTIEISLGALEGILRSTSDVSTYSVDEDRVVIAHDLRPSCKIAIMTHNFQLEYFDCIPTTPRLEDSIISELCDAFDLIEAKKKEPVVEFMIVENQLIISDMSFNLPSSNTPQLNSTETNGVRWLKPGDIKGLVTELSSGKVDELASLLGQRQSVIPSPFELERRSSPEVLLWIQNNIPENTDIILAPYPDIALVVLMDKVSGFIFKRGAILSHFAIVLRQSSTESAIVGDEEYSNILKKGKVDMSYQ